jgi:hypothetical protein
MPGAEGLWTVLRLDGRPSRGSLLKAGDNSNSASSTSFRIWRSSVEAKYAASAG